MKTNLLISVFMIFLSACSDKVVDNIDDISLPHSEEKIYDYVKINDSTLVFSQIVDSLEGWKIIDVTSDYGEIEVYADKVKFKSPSYPGISNIKYTIENNNKTRYVDSIKIVVFSQLLFLKADDIINEDYKPISEKWERFINLIIKKKAKASLGIIAKTLDWGGFYYESYLKGLNATGQFEIWNHGFDHFDPHVNSDGIFVHEFKNSSFEQQLEHLRLAQNYVKDKLGITMHTFGAPGNAIDNNTIKALDEIEEIKVWYYGLLGSSKLVLNRTNEIEITTFNPNYQKFIENYSSGSEYLALQIHPNAWDKNQFSEFEKILDFLIANKVTFMNPYEYYLVLENKRILNSLVKE